jgi:quinol-cytochrome oxidoreductase complex cytochrome b subunit
MRFDIRKWIEERIHFNELPLKPSPDYMRKWGGKWYWTGGLITIAFFYEIITGLILLLYYNPSDPYGATQYILTQLPYGSLLLSTHLYGAYAMIILVYVHMFRNYFVGAYKKPRELQWVTGVILLALTLGVGYFGYSLTGDVLSYDAQDVGEGIAGSIPYIGNWLVNIGFGNGTPTSLFSRFLGWHIIFAGLIFLLFGVHFFMAESNGMMPRGKDVNYKAPAIIKDYSSAKPWYPYNFLYMIELGLFSIGFIIFVPSFLGLIPNIPVLLSPFPGPAPTNILASTIPPYPPWFLLFIYKAVDFGFFAYSPIGALEASIIFGLIPLVYLLLVPFLDRSDSTHPLDRPFFTSVGILSIVYLIILSLWGAFTPGVIIPPSQVFAVLVPPAVIVFASVYLISKVWKNGGFIKAEKTMPLSIIVYAIIGSLVFYLASKGISLLLHGISITSLLYTGSSLLAAPISIMGISKSIDKVADKKMKSFGWGSIIAILVLTIIVWTLAYFAFKMNPTSQAQLFGMILGTAFILTGTVVAIYRRAVYGE